MTGRRVCTRGASSSGGSGALGTGGASANISSWRYWTVMVRPPLGDGQRAPACRARSACSLVLHALADNFVSAQATTSALSYKIRRLNIMYGGPGFVPLAIIASVLTAIG